MQELSRNAPEPLISIEKLTRAYDPSAPVLRSVDLAIQPGEFLVIIGRSGSGKSTLLNLLGLLDSPDSGDVFFHGVSMGACTEARRALLRRRSIGFVFQAFNLLDTLTVLDNLMLPLELLSVSRPLALEKARHWMDALELNGLESRFPAELSGGQQQRVAVARALVHEPELILADEPTGNLDLETAADLVGRLDTLCRQAGHTLVMATHSRQVMGMADRVLRIVDGALVEETDV